MFFLRSMNVFCTLAIVLCIFSRLLGMMGNQGKHAKYSLRIGVQCQIISVKFRFSNISELETYDTRNKEDFTHQV